MNPRRFLAVLATLLALAFANLAAGQGTEGMLAPPIDTPSLERIAARLGLSEAQRQAARGFHGRYLQDARALRSGEVQSLLERQGALSSGFLPSRDDVRDFIDRWERVRDRSRQLDDRLLDELATMLTEEQFPRLEVVRLQRARERLQSADMILSGSVLAKSDLRGLVESLHVPPGETLDAIGILLLDHERRVVAALEKADGRSRRTILAMFDRLAEAGIGAGTPMEDEGTMAKVQEITESFWANEMAEQIAAAHDSRTEAERTVATIASMLPPDEARRLRRDAVRELDPELGWGFDDWNGIRDPIGAVLRLDELSPEERETLAGLLAALDPVVDQAFAKARAALRDREARMSPFDFDVEAMQESERILEEQRDLARSSTAGAVEAAQAALGDRWNDLIGRAQTAELPVGAIAIEAGAAAIEEPMEWPGDWAIARRISVRDRRELERRLVLRDGEDAIMENLYDEYVAAYGACPEARSLRDAQASLWQHDEATGRVAPAADAPTAPEIASMRRRLPDALDLIDDAFFENIELALGDERRRSIIALSRLARRIDVHRVSSFGWFPGGETQESEVNLLDLALDCVAADGISAALDETLRACAERTIPLLRARHDASVEQSRIQDDFQRMSMLAEAEGDTVDWSAMQARMEPANEALATANRALAEEMRRGAETISSLLADDDDASFRRAVRRAAYPTVCTNELDPGRVLERASTLPDLTPEQRRTIDDLRLEALPEYERICDEMIEMLVSAERTIGAQDWPARQAVAAELERLRFDRDEVFHRIAARLRDVLPPELAASIRLDASRDR